MSSKKILITGGPTNEYIDEVMKITNMSTGSFSIALVKAFGEAGYDVTAILNNSVNTETLPQNVKIINIETTDEMLNAIKNVAIENEYQACLHTAAVGDYTADFSFLMSDMANEIFENLDNIKTSQDILDIMLNPQKSKLDSSSKISSYQSDLTVKLGLTPKIISSLRKWMPNTVIIGCKLLENVSKDELFDVAQKLVNKNALDYVMANDLADLRKGEKTRYLISKTGFTNVKVEHAKDVVTIVERELKG